MNNTPLVLLTQPAQLDLACPDHLAQSDLARPARPAWARPDLAHRTKAGHWWNGTEWLDRNAPFQTAWPAWSPEALAHGQQQWAQEPHWPGQPDLTQSVVMAAHPHMLNSRNLDKALLSGPPVMLSWQPGQTPGTLVLVLRWGERQFRTFCDWVPETYIPLWWFQRQCGFYTSSGSKYPNVSLWFLDGTTCPNYTSQIERHYHSFSFVEVFDV